MKYMNLKKKYQSFDLQLFAEGEGDGGGIGDGDDDPDGDDDDPDGDDDPEEKKFSRKDVDDAVKKHIARERRKWKREQKESSGKGIDKTGDDGKKDEPESEDAKKRKAAEQRAEAAEIKVICYEAGIVKDSVDDVVALARSYMVKDEDLDIEDAIEKVVKKYPQFKKADDDDADDVDDGKKGKSWGERQKGTKKKEKSLEDEIAEAIYGKK